MAAQVNWRKDQKLQDSAVIVLKATPYTFEIRSGFFIFRDISENRSQNLGLPLLDSDDYWSARDYKLMWSVGFVAKVKRPEWLKLSFQLVRITCSAAYITAAFHCLLSYTEYSPQNNKNSSSYVPHLPAVNNGIQKRINKCQSPSEH